jgi:hypothetical protein
VPTSLNQPVYASFDELVAAEGMAAWRGTRRIRGRRNHGGPPCPARRPRLHLATAGELSPGCDNPACEEDLEDTLLERARRLGVWDYPAERPSTTSRLTASRVTTSLITATTGTRGAA